MIIYKVKRFFIKCRDGIIVISRSISNPYYGATTVKSSEEDSTTTYRGFGTSPKVKYVEPKSGVNKSLKALDDKRLKTLQREFHKVENMLTKVFVKDQQQIAISKWFKILNKNLNHKGITGTLTFIKNIKVSVQQLALKQEVTPHLFTKCDKGGFPTAVLFLRKLLESDENADIQLCVTLVRVVELIKLDPTYDYSSITDSFEGTHNYSSLLNEFKEWLPSWKGIKLFKRLNSNNSLPSISEVRFPGKSGPNSWVNPKITASMLMLPDLAGLVNDDKLAYNVGELIKLTNNTLYEIFIKYFNIVRSKPVNSSYLNSKIISLSDKAGKERIVAMGDWWSNVALSGIHLDCNNFLRSYRHSVSHRQEDIPNEIKNLGENLFSADLTAFTDRFPRTFQYEILRCVYSDSVADLWTSVIANRTFSSKIGDILYSIGNPMGLLSSWSVSTITHHAFLEFINYKVNKDNKDKLYNFNYIMLGDDQCCNDENVYKVYIESLADIGVKTSLAKCTTSFKGYCEFAKRYFTPKGEITGIPITAINSFGGNPVEVLQVIKLVKQREVCPDVIIRLASFMISKSFKRFRRTLELLSICPFRTEFECALLGLTPDTQNVFSDVSESELNENLKHSFKDLCNKKIEKCLDTIKTLSRDVEYTKLENSLIRIENGQLLHRLLADVLENSLTSWKLNNVINIENIHELSALVPTIEINRSKVTKSSYLNDTIFQLLGTTIETQLNKSEVDIEKNNAEASVETEQTRDISISRMQLLTPLLLSIVNLSLTTKKYDWR